MSEESLIFSEFQQHAVVGHALQQPNIWNLLKEMGVDAAWFVSAALSDTWKHLENFKNAFNRLPLSVDELADSVKDELLQGALKRSIAKCVDAKKRHPWDVLEKKLVDWAKARAVFVGSKQIATLWNDGKQADAYKLLQDTATQLENIEAAAGLEPDGFMSAADRVKQEEEARNMDSKNIIKWAVPYLQDSMGGLLPTDVALIGATSGAGKTELGKLQAQKTASEGFPVHYFALEAEPFEIERRIKYGMLGQYYKFDHPGTPEGMISYRRFRHSELQQEFAPYVDKVHEEFDTKYKTLYTYYRKRGDFGIRQLDREIAKLKGKSRLVVLDHIHFMDMETDNETREMSLLIKRIRQISMGLSIPMVIIAHINKAGNRYGGLVPDKEDFYGAGNLFKTATVAVMMAPARGMVTADSRAVGKPTFMRPVKVRVDNSSLWTPGISFFNSWTLDYSPYYSVGRFDKGGRRWSSMKGDLPYWVNIENNIVDISDIEA